MSTPLLLATTNVGKRREIEAVLQPVGVQWRNLADFPDLEEPVEDQDTFQGNARKKALHYARGSGLVTLADDSGLEVDALDGAPGVFSARFAGPDCDDAANNTKLIQCLRGIPDAPRSARFRCVIAVARPTGEVVLAGGQMDGLIIDGPRGANGFGYDPHFLIVALDRTLAELDGSHKNRISHRGVALRSLLEKLPNWLASTANGGPPTL
jgi:XTP/dITP diphosphohydrolase